MGKVMFMNHEICGKGPGRIIKVIGMVILGVIGISLLALLFGVFVKLLWNALMPVIFGLPEIGFWQAVGLVVLGHILFGGHDTKHERSPRRKKISSDSPFHQEMEKDYVEFWRQEGRDAFQQWMGRENGEEALPE